LLNFKKFPIIFDISFKFNDLGASKIYGQWTAILTDIFYISFKINALQKLRHFMIFLATKQSFTTTVTLPKMLPAATVEFSGTIPL